MTIALKTLCAAAALSLTLVSGAAFAQATPVVGTIGITSEEVLVVAKGWSIKKDILDKDVFNEANEKVGTISDIIVTPVKAMSYAIVGTGGFLGIAEHDVVIPLSQLTIKDKRVLLPGATKEAVKAMPAFKYSN
ncbi:PRC-barrel domain containing protein [Desulfovibrio sulfodismutans]|uniref:PRC-barrel domain containing protein n=1 Tax=Desulfolutivibrio sulfodismutans TaxID=63561 RepID=A0A7K3NG80_9BACT|nr:PRC-barrel domain-containing protein [Desulfolutivibrio sulfodismutans]NDY55190.1 PRC-barrel domain containing protein [Desulfolutivibrio sulfodismutans]QLA12156.1 PRC-barrel domain containing protein [Desulfolutivibrio sulfodismutans DSM 3696]